MVINKLHTTSLLVCTSLLSLNASEHSNWKIKTLDEKESLTHTQRYSEPILTLFTEHPILHPEQTIAIEKWHMAHLEFRKQWHLLRQTPEYEFYYKLKGNRAEAKVKKNATLQGQAYVIAKKNAYELLTKKKVPKIKISYETFILVPTKKQGYKLIPLNRLKYTQ